MFNKLEFYFKEIIYNRKRGWLPSLIKVGLLPLSWLYRGGVSCRNWVYDKGWMRRYVPPVPLVISVGNIVAGGTGKTPVTLLLAQAFYNRFALAILSRGYRSKAEKLDSPVVLCEGEGPLYPANYCGDEPYLFAQRLPKAHIIVGSNRQKACYLAVKAGVEIILLDDGMQHRRLARDLEVVVIDVCDPFGQGYFLPRGFLRDDRKSLSRAHLIILNHIADSNQFEWVRKQMVSYTSAPMIGTNLKMAGIKDLKGKEIGSLKDVKVGMFCGIAHPDYFRRTLQELGAHVVSEYWLPDHGEMVEKELACFGHACLSKEAKWLICTEKDRVKLQDDLASVIPIAWLQMELEVLEGKKEWEHFLAKAEAKLS